MSRIYTVRTRDVVVGMILVGDVDTVIDAAIATDIHSAYEPEYAIDIRLPGPSPRELLCIRECCTGWPHPEQVLKAATRPWAEHIDGCPVRRLRLRLWPAPNEGRAFTWDGERWCTRALSVSPKHLADLEPGQLLGPLLIALFCDPEVMP